MMSYQIIDQALLQATSERARQSPRKRINHNFHADNESVCHRLLNAVEPGSYCAPHRHLDPNKQEGMIILSGRLGLVFFDETGGIAGKVVLEPGGECVALDIGVGTYHTILSLAPGTIFYETKAGPYRALLPEERAAWAPAEGDPGATAYLARLEALFT
jgi:cupin fold WbuC family metalloprotein